ncbi:MAG: sortase [Candidatus Saccharibacteria bacterium]
MKPDENNSSKGGTPLSARGSIVAPQKQHNLSVPAREAAAKIILTKINNLHDQQDRLDAPYNHTHDNNKATKTTDWQQYHSAWQDYYQKYYEGYYTHHLRAAKQHIIDKNKPTQASETDQIESELRAELLDRVKNSTTKVRKSKHFVPIISALIVVLIFVLLQYNRVIIGTVMAYISPGNIDPQNIIIDPNENITVSTDPRLIIPKINVDVPVNYDVGNDYKSQIAAMKNGVAHFAIPGASSHPGEIGNTAIAGHSSNDLFSVGDYKFIFAQLEKLNVGDTVYANYHSKRYTYSITKKDIVGPNDVSKLVYPTDKPILTLITCVPVGTATSRLLVTAEQISPDPAKSTAAPTAITNTTDNSSMAGSSPTFLEWIFGAR